MIKVHHRQENVSCHVVFMKDDKRLFSGECVKMRDKNILLTYIKDGKQGFDWFDDITDMEISIIERGIKENEICDIIKINDCEDLELSFVCKNCMEGDKNDC